jgi:hypothetical protein
MKHKTTSTTTHKKELDEFWKKNKKQNDRKVEKHGTNQSGTPNEKWIIIIVIIVTLRL